MIHHPLCGCDAGTDGVQGHEWLPEGTTLMVFTGEQVARISDLHFGARWKYMGERRRWRRLIRTPTLEERPVPRTGECKECGGLRYKTYVRNLNARTPKHYTRLCRACGYKRGVHIWRVRGPRQRQWDEANLVAACRPLIDSLVEHGWLVDDGPKYMEARYSDAPKRQQGGTIIVLGGFGCATE